MAASADVATWFTKQTVLVTPLLVLVLMLGASATGAASTLVQGLPGSFSSTRAATKSSEASAATGSFCRAEHVALHEAPAAPSTQVGTAGEGWDGRVGWIQSADHGLMGLWFWGGLLGLDEEPKIF